MKNSFAVSLFLFCMMLPFSLKAQISKLSLESSHLNRTIEVYYVKSATGEAFRPIVYFTDGKKMINNGTLKQIERLGAEGKIPAADYVFVSTVDAKSGTDHRNEYFFCNENYLKFFEQELIPKIEGELLKTLKARSSKDRTLIGISFGGLNGAYFAAQSKLFGSYGLLSPVTYPRQKELMKQIAFSENRDLKIFLSTGTNDAERYYEQLKASYETKRYKLKTLQTKGGHDFRNWNAQLQVMLDFLIE